MIFLIWYNSNKVLGFNPCNNPQNQLIFFKFDGFYKKIIKLRLKKVQVIILCKNKIVHTWERILKNINDYYDHFPQV